MKTRTLFGIALACALITATAAIEAPKREDVTHINVIVSGRIPQPGKIQIKQGEKLLDAIVKAGGAVEDPMRVLVLRRGKDGRDEKLELILKGGKKSDRNIVLQDKDTILIPSGKTAPAPVQGA